MASATTLAHAGAAGVANRTTLGIGGIVKKSAARFASSLATNSGFISSKYFFIAATESGTLFRDIPT